MEDTLVKVGMYAYQLRVDISDNTVVDKWLEHYKAPYYLYGMEVSPKGKPHCQCIVWFSKKVNTAKLRNWFKGKTLKTKQPVSLTVAKNVESLIKYCSKDGNVKTNLNEKELKTLGTWEDKVNLKKQFRDKLFEYAASIAFQPYELVATIDETLDGYFNQQVVIDTPNAEEFRDFVVKIFDFYRENGRYPVRRVIDALLFKHHYVSSDNLYRKWFL